MHLVRKELGEVPTATVPTPDFARARPGPALLVGKLHDQPAFGQFIEMAYPEGEDLGPGPKTVWMKAPHLLATEAPSPIQAICPLADCGNGISWNEPPARFGFMNTDLTLQIHREPQGDWFAAEAVSHWQPNGIGMSPSASSDERSVVTDTSCDSLSTAPETVTSARSDADTVRSNSTVRAVIVFSAAAINE
jgi:hypothetical protein